jgi:serine/threonine-protein kinase RsbW
MLLLTTGPEDLDRLYPWLEAEAANLPKPVRHAMHVAAEEIVMNAAMHAFAQDDPGRIIVSLEIVNGFAALTIEDTGAAFDPIAAPVPGRFAGLEPGRLGLVLLRHYCQDIRYERAGDLNRLTMRFPL